ncbi:hypothetical protein NDU88_002341 [Pleurodeles waltl]|uniref:Uncharacterized protein n=1 Tax=Pleurodeles waltl TaxID=8319 RepID=A0AAV7T1U6_PLEWA|nr:hypothetical protein NDU88_002341 [Pleurodeles waltl]
MKHQGTVQTVKRGTKTSAHISVLEGLSSSLEFFSLVAPYDVRKKEIIERSTALVRRRSPAVKNVSVAVFHPELKEVEQRDCGSGLSRPFGLRRVRTLIPVSLPGQDLKVSHAPHRPSPSPEELAQGVERSHREAFYA